MFLLLLEIKKKKQPNKFKKEDRREKKIHKSENKNLVLFFKSTRVSKCNLDNFLFKNYKDIIGTTSVSTYLLVYVIYVGEIVRTNLPEDSAC